MVTSRIWFTAAQKAELWERWKNGQSAAAISRGAGKEEQDRRWADRGTPWRDRAGSVAAVKRQGSTEAKIEAAYL